MTDLSDDELRALERSRLQALVHKDMPRAWQLHAPDFQLITPSGAVMDREAYLSTVAGGGLNYFRWAAGAIAVRRFPGLALLRYQAELQMGDDPAQPQRFSCWHTDSYELRPEGWQVVWSQATLLR